MATLRTTLFNRVATPHTPQCTPTALRFPTVSPGRDYLTFHSFLTYWVVAYVRKHFPFISFETIYTNQTRCNKLYNSDMFWTHLKEGKLPQFVYYVPNLLNDGHDTDAAYYANYIQQTWVDTFYNNEYFNTGALNYLSLDESGNTTGFNTVPGDNNNHVYAAIWGDAVTNRDTYDKYDFVRYNHSSITATLEMNWWGKTGLLGRNDTYAPVFSLPYTGAN